MFVGETGVQRIMMRSLELQKENPDVRQLGGIPLETIQRYINYWFCYSIDLFGSEISSNAADYFAAGIKGRYREGGGPPGQWDASTPRYEDHVALEGHRVQMVPREGRLHAEDVPLRNAMNEMLREEYAEDCDRVVKRWNRALEEAGADFRVTLPHTRFFRRQGIYAGSHYDYEGNPITAEQFEARKHDWLPSEEERAYVRSLMGPAITEPGKFANWIQPPSRGINGQPVDFEYVRFE